MNISNSMITSSSSSSSLHSRTDIASTIGTDIASTIGVGEGFPEL